MHSDKSEDPRRTRGQGLNKEQALQRILEGHWRYVASKSNALRVTDADRQQHAEAQYPFAAILGCADSRVSPELIFDQRQGDLFVVRVAGNVLGSGELASLEYAVEQLGVRVILVLGHEKCGAVNAAMSASDGPGEMGFLLREIAPAVAEARQKYDGSFDMAVELNVVRVTSLLSLRSQTIHRAVERGEIQIVGGLYQLRTGDVKFVTHVG